MRHGRACALPICLMFAACLPIRAHVRAQESDFDWAKDPRSLALTTEGLEDLLPTPPERPNKTGFGELLGEWTWRELGIPGDYAGAGLSIDHPYLYLSNQDYHRVYIVDISTGIPNPLLWFDAPGTWWTWGLGMDNDHELWVGEVYAWDPFISWVYEMTTFPPTPELTGNNFDCRRANWWNADITDNVPWDTIYMVRVQWPNKNIVAYHEPSGEIGREIGNPAWNYVSQRALAYNEDNGTLFVGGWHSDSMWEISLGDGTPLPGRSFYAQNAAGAAYQSATVGGPCLWIQSNEQVDVLRKYRVMADDACVPIEPWGMRSQGYWRRQCKDDGQEDVCTYIDSVHALADLFDAFDCGSGCYLMRADPPESDMCRKAKRQFMALLLNVASGKLAVCNCLDDGREVGDMIAEIDSLLSANPDFHTCEYAKTLADDINNGIGIVPCETTWIQAPPETVQPPSVLVVPNPFSESTVIEYKLSVPIRVRLEVYDKVGRFVRTLVDATQTPGFHEVEWDGLGDDQTKVPAGVYILRLENSTSVQLKKLIFLGHLSP